MRAILMHERRGGSMPSYKEMYLTLVRAQRDAILILQEAQQQTEEMFLARDVPDHLRVMPAGPLRKGAQAEAPQSETER